MFIELSVNVHYNDDVLQRFRTRKCRRDCVPNRKPQCKQKEHVTSNRKHEVCDDSSSDADEFAYVINESRRALQFTGDEINRRSSGRVDTTSVVSSIYTVSYTHLTLPTNREV